MNPDTSSPALFSGALHPLAMNGPGSRGSGQPSLGKTSEGFGAEWSDLLPVAIFAADGCGRFLKVNTRWTALTGQPVNQSLGTGWLKAVAAEDRARVEVEVAAGFQRSSRVSVLFRLAGSDEVNEKSARLIAERPAEGGLWYGMALLIEEASAIEALRKSEERLRLVTKASSDSVYDWNILTGELYWSAGYKTQFGGDSCEITTTIEEWEGRVHPDDLKRIHDSLYGFVERGETQWLEEYRFRRTDGSYARVWDRGYLMRNGEGKPARMIGSMLDISTLREVECKARNAEARLRKIAAGVPGMVFQYKVHPDGRTTLPYVSEGVAQIYGVTPEQVGSDPSVLTNLIHPDDLRGVRESVAASAKTRELWHHEFRICLASGEVKWVLGSSMPDTAVDEDGALAWHGVVTDVSERKELERRLAIARDEALAASRLKSEFLANMSHEIRTPMNGVIGMVSLLRETELNPDQRQMCRIIQSSADGLLHVINDILDFSKIEAGKLRLEDVPFELKASIREAVAPLAPRAVERGIELTFDFESVGDLVLLGDGGRISQIVTNLVSNAIKFTQRGSVRVSLAAPAVSSAEVLFRLSVADTGIGIPDSIQPSLFQSFVQADSSTTRRFGGTGLGLAICKQLVELMGGNIGFTSREGEGSMFWFELKLLRAKRDLIQADSVPQALQSSPALRILVAEDNVTNQVVTRRSLEKLGHQVEIVSNGELALRTLASGQFDAVFMDCHMPVLDGYDATRRLRAGEVQGANRLVPVIALTASAMLGDRAKCLEAGMTEYVAKPVKVGDLDAALRRCGF